MRLLVFGVLLAGSCRSAPEAPAELLDRVPQDCLVYDRAKSWEDLVLQTRPTLVLSRSLLLWCHSTGDEGWTFDLAQTFLVEGGDWVLLGEPDDWIHSDLQGLFVSGSARYPSAESGDGPRNHVERLSDSVYKVSVTTVPGGNHANQSTLSVLLRHRADGSWEQLWTGEACTNWSMGSYGVDEDYDFDVTGGTILVRQRKTLYPSFDLDQNASLILDLVRSGSLAGGRIDWETPWSPVMKEGVERTLQEYYPGAVLPFNP